MYRLQICHFADMFELYQYLKFCFVLFSLVKIQDNVGQKQEKVYGTSKILESPASLFQIYWYKEQYLQHDRSVYIVCNAYNISEIVQQ